MVVYEPIGEVPLPLRLDWKLVPPADSYRITVQSSGGELIWEASADRPPLEIPPDVRERLREGATSFWQVEALGDEERWTSPTTRFTVVP